MYIFPIFCKKSEKTQFFEIILKIHPTKRENAFGNLNYISFVTWAVTENPNLFWLAFGTLENWKTIISFLANRVDNLNYVHQNWGTSKISKNWKSNQNLSFWIRKNQLS